jgi:hypothetical protein
MKKIGFSHEHVTGSFWQVNTATQISNQDCFTKNTNNVEQ